MISQLLLHKLMVQFCPTVSHTTTLIRIVIFSEYISVNIEPECLDESLDLLGLALNPDVVLKFPERLIQLHALEVHFIHHTAVVGG